MARCGGGGAIIWMLGLLYIKLHTLMRLRRVRRIYYVCFDLDLIRSRAGASVGWGLFVLSTFGW